MRNTLGTGGLLRRIHVHTCPRILLSGTNRGHVRAWFGFSSVLPMRSGTAACMVNNAAAPRYALLTWAPHQNTPSHVRMREMQALSPWLAVRVDGGGCLLKESIYPTAIHLSETVMLVSTLASFQPNVVFVQGMQVHVQQTYFADHHISCSLLCPTWAKA